MTKIVCIYCKKEFERKSNYHIRCIECGKKKDREHSVKAQKKRYHNNLEKYRKYFRDYYKKNRKKIRQRYKNIREKNKQILVEYKGGKCEICGYNKCLKALDFHHNKGKKEFRITLKTHVIKGIDALKKEVDKCILVCANCHREIHSKLGYNHKTI